MYEINFHLYLCGSRNRNVWKGPVPEEVGQDTTSSSPKRLKILKGNSNDENPPILGYSPTLIFYRNIKKVLLSTIKGRTVYSCGLTISCFRFFIKFELGCFKKIF